MVFEKGHKFYKGAEKGWFTSEQMRGNKFGFKKGQGIGNSNYAKRPDVRKKISEKLKGRNMPWMMGENHHNWKNGASFEDYPKEFFMIREEILERDNFVCRLCKKQILEQTKELFISVHHKDYNKLNNKPDNLVSLCNFCNSRVNFNRNHWQEFFKGVS